MKSIVIFPDTLGTKLPKSSSHKLDLDIFHALVGYEVTKVESILFHGSEFKLTIDKSIANSICYTDFDKELDELLAKELPDFVAVFDIETLMKVKDKKISNLYLFLSEIPSNVPTEVKDLIDNSKWIKVISFLPKNVIHDRLRVDKYCEPYLHFMGDFDDIQKIENEVPTIAVPIDFSAVNFYGDPPVNEIMELLDKNYPNCEVYFSFIGAKVVEVSKSSRVHVVGCNTLGEYLKLLSTCDLQAIINVPDCINLYPFYAAELGIRTAFYSKTELLPELACPFIPSQFIEILGSNDVSVQADLNMIEDVRTYFKSLANSYDEIRFNLNIHSIIRSLDYDYRFEYRKSLQSRLDELEGYYKSHPELMKLKLKEDKNEGTEDNESTPAT